MYNGNNRPRRKVVFSGLFFFPVKVLLFKKKRTFVRELYFRNLSI